MNRTHPTNWWWCVFFFGSHRPVDVNNMYNAVQVKLLMKPDDLSDVPEFDEVFREEEEVLMCLVILPLFVSVCMEIVSWSVEFCCETTYVLLKNIFL